MDLPTRRPRELSLFTGIGGGCLGSQILGWRTVCYVERDPFCQRVLQRRIADGWLDDAPIWDDVRSFDGAAWQGKVDVCTAGFPCQPFSVAGARRAGKDPRDLWPDTARVLREVRPPVALLENVPNLARGSHGYFGRVLGDLHRCGYDACWDIVPAAAVCAPHRRERLWILAWDSDTDRDGRRPEQRRVSEGESDAEGGDEDLANTRSGRGPKDRLPAGRAQSGGGNSEERNTGWFPEPDVRRLADGVSDRVDRLKSLGNAQVPQQMALAWTLLSRRMRRILDSPPAAPLGA